MISAAEPINVDGPKKNGRPSGRNTKWDSVPRRSASSRSCSRSPPPPLGSAGSHSFARRSITSPTIPEKAKMEINTVCERECKLKQKLRLTDSLVRRGIKRFRVTESSIDFILRSNTDSNNLVLLNQLSILSTNALCLDLGV